MGQSIRSLGSTMEGKKYTSKLRRHRASVLKIIVHNSLTTIPEQSKLQGALRDSSFDGHGQS